MPHCRERGAWSGLCPGLASPHVPQIKSIRKNLEKILHFYRTCPCFDSHRAVPGDHLPLGWCPGHPAAGDLCPRWQGGRMSVVVMPPSHEREHPKGRRTHLRGAEL